MDSGGVWGFDVLLSQLKLTHHKIMNIIELAKKNKDIEVRYHMKTTPNSINPVKFAPSKKEEIISITNKEGQVITRGSIVKLRKRGDRVYSYSSQVEKSSYVVSEIANISSRIDPYLVCIANDDKMNNGNGSYIEISALDAVLSEYDGEYIPEVEKNYKNQPF